MKKYTAPELEVIDIKSTEIFTESGGDGDITLPEDNFNN